MSTGDTFHYGEYVSDNGTHYCVKLSDVVAAEGNFNSIIDPLSFPVWPFGEKCMRHVTGKSSTGKRDRLPIARNDDSKYMTGGSFSLHGTTYAILGAEGERRPASRIR